MVVSQSLGATDVGEGDDLLGDREVTRNDHRAVGLREGADVVASRVTQVGTRSDPSFAAASSASSASLDSTPEGAALAELGGDDHAVPAALSMSGVFRPMPGVQRQVTGFFFPELEELRGEARQVKSSRLWYAAIDHRPRGPFAATEMIDLAEKGKIRDATLVWRPGFAAWRKVRHGASAGSPEDLSWLRKPVLARKLREIEAQDRAQRMGIPAVSLTRSSSGGRRSTWSGGAEGLPPPLPSADDPAALPATTEPRAMQGALELALFGPPDAFEPVELRCASLDAAPSELLASPLPVLGLMDAGAVASGASEVLPFAWRADELPPTEGARVRRRKRVLVAAALIALVTLVALVAGALTFALVRGVAMARATSGADLVVSMQGETSSSSRASSSSFLPPASAP